MPQSNNASKSSSSISVVWNYFTKCDKNEAICKICSKKVKLGGGTSNLRQHIKYKHPEHTKEIDENNSRKTRSGEKRKRASSTPPSSGDEGDNMNTLNTPVFPSSSVSAEILSRPPPSLSSPKNRILLELQAKVPKNEYKITKAAMNEERALRMELLKLEVYKSRLQCRKLEVELNLPKGDLTSEIQDPHIVILNPDYAAMDQSSMITENENDNDNDNDNDVNITDSGNIDV